MAIDWNRVDSKMYSDDKRPYYMTRDECNKFLSKMKSLEEQIEDLKLAIDKIKRHIGMEK